MSITLAQVGDKGVDNVTIEWSACGVSSGHYGQPTVRFDDEPGVGHYGVDPGKILGANIPDGARVQVTVCSCGHSYLRDKGCGRCLCGARETPCVAS